MSSSPFKFSCDNKRYYTLNYYNRRNYCKKIYKAVIDLDLTCPNIDGSKGRGGCIFCDGGSGYFTHGELDIVSQLKCEADRIAAKHGKNAEFIAYFQANTNTYAPVEFLRSSYYTALQFPNVFGISIGTRADCLSDEVISLLAELNSQTHLTVELGMQSSKEQTISLINRCCTHEEFKSGYYALKKAGIRTCLHIINGLPYESYEDMLETAHEASILNPDAVKLQMLHVIQNTKLAEMYSQNQFRLLEREEYIDVIVKQLELLAPETVVERITGDGDKRKLIAPLWSADKIAVLGGIDKKLAELNTWQGRLYSNK